MQAHLIGDRGINTAEAAFRFIFTFEKIIAMPVPKLIHIQNGQRNFIRFSGKPSMIIEVLLFDSDSDLNFALKTVENDFHSIDMLLFSFSKLFKEKHYLFIVTRFLNGFSPVDEKRIIRVLEHAADWYLHNTIK